MSLEDGFDITFTAMLAQREKQIQQSYRPFIGIHKWFARRPGSVFRSLLLSEFNGEEALETAYWRAHQMRGVIADPFAGGGTPILEATRLGFSVVGADINPMSFWIVRQSLAPLDLLAFKKAAEEVMDEVEGEIGQFYTTVCTICGEEAQVKYFIWVKTQRCPDCGAENDLFPGYLLAEAVRHPAYVVACRHCGCLNEFDRQPTRSDSLTCKDCGESVYVEGTAIRNKVTCRACGSSYRYPPAEPTTPPTHRMWAIEYHCSRCKPDHKGRFFKKPDAYDLRKVIKAEKRLRKLDNLPIPSDRIPVGDETRRLHRWGYTRFREMFNPRQLLGLGILLRRIRTEQEKEVRYALLTVFSDFLRYQNMLCRYDVYALKCQDIFSVHGFPVGLIQCEAALIGIPNVGSGAFRHFINKYLRAKEYCERPFETRVTGRTKKVVPIVGERIEAKLAKAFPQVTQRAAFVKASSAEKIAIPPASLNGVFTDPPYYDNVQYAELMDFCYAWLRLGLGSEFSVFRPTTTRTHSELTGNAAMGRGLDHFTEGLSKIYCHYAGGLKPGAPFVFTYHHNDPLAYVPLVVAILDADLDCSATFPVPGEMGASLHIARSNSSVLDTVFVCRRMKARANGKAVEKQLRKDIAALKKADLKVTEGDIRCLLAGHLARIAINGLRDKWNKTLPLQERVRKAEEFLQGLRDHSGIPEMIARLQGEGLGLRNYRYAASV